MKKKEQKQEKHVAFTTIDEATDCTKCAPHGDVNMIINFGFNKRDEELPKAVTLYKVMCSHCKKETSWFTTDGMATASWNKTINKKSN